MAYSLDNMGEPTEEEKDNLGTSSASGSTDIPTEGAPAGGTTTTASTTTGDGGVTPTNNTATSTSEQNNGARPTGSSQANYQSTGPNADSYNTEANANAITNEAGKIATNLNSQTSDTNTAITAGTTNLNNDVTAGTPQVDTDLNQRIVSNPTAISTSDQAGLDKELSGTYTGPTSSSSYYAGASEPAGKATQNAEVLEQPTIAGPQTYFGANGVQGGGNQTLDASLLLRTKSAQDALKPAVTSAQAAGANVAGATATGDNTIIPGGSTNATATQTTTQDALTKGITDYTGQGNDAAAANIQKYNDLANKTTAFLQTPTAITGTPTADQAAALSALGYSTDQWNQLVTAYNDLAQVQYVQNLVSTSGMPITQDPKTGNYINQLTGEAIVFPANLPPPANIDLSKGLTVGEASQLFNIGNSTDPKILGDIQALEGLLGQSGTVAATPTGPNGTQFAYTAPDLGTNIQSAQSSLNNSNNLAQVAINAARQNPSAAMKSGTTLGVAYAIGGAALVSQVAKSLIQGGSAPGSAVALGTALNKVVVDGASALGASDTTAAAIGNGAGAVGAALAYVGAAYGVYSFIANYQSGDSARDALSGAETGAQIGALFGGIGAPVGMVIGAVVGAIAGLFGHKTDPENAYFNNYTQNYATNSQNGQGDAAAEAFPKPYLALAGLFDLQPNQVKGSIPFYQKYGRMGEQSFVNDMVSQIDAAGKAGSITAYSSPDYIYSNVIEPWINKMGNWTDSNKDAMVSLFKAMIGQYTAGDTSSWTAIGGDNPFSTLPPFSQFVSEAYAPAQWMQPGLPGNTTANPISVYGTASQQPSG